MMAADAIGDRPPPRLARASRPLSKNHVAAPWF
jgi:hypothetical protein